MALSPSLRATAWLALMSWQWGGGRPRTAERLCPAVTIALAACDASLGADRSILPLSTMMAVTVFEQHEEAGGRRRIVKKIE